MVYGTSYAVILQESAELVDTKNSGMALNLNKTGAADILKQISN